MAATTTMEVSYSYLKSQFAPNSALAQDILRDIADELARSGFTLGPWVDRFEAAICDTYGVKNCVGLNSGTDALFLGLKVMGVGPGDSVATIPNTFVATVAAIVAVGATPLLVDIGDDYLMDLSQPALSSVKTAIPVFLTGLAKPSSKWTNTLNDATQAFGAEYEGHGVAAYPNMSAFSLHPLKNLNVWGDGGFVTTNNDGYASDLRLLRNHGLIDRDTAVMPGYNSRLDSIQAIVACHVLKEIDWIIERRVVNAKRYDDGLRGCPGVTFPARDPLAKQVYHTYVVTVDDRENLQEFLSQRGVQTKIHYPTPVHLTPGYRYLGYKAGDFPVCEAQATRILSLPIHQYVTEQQIDWVIESIRSFYEKSETAQPVRPDPRSNNRSSA